MDETPSIGQQLAALRRPRERICAVCGRTFTTIGRGIYCGSTCQKRAYRQRKREKEQPDGPPANQ